jgi:hypothetical protein
MGPSGSAFQVSDDKVVDEPGKQAEHHVVEVDPARNWLAATYPEE